MKLCCLGPAEAAEILDRSPASNYGSAVSNGYHDAG